MEFVRVGTTLATPRNVSGRSCTRVADAALCSNADFRVVAESAAAPFAESGRVPVRNAPTGVASVPVTRTKRGETPYLVEFVRVGTTLATPRNVSGRGCTRVADAALCSNADFRVVAESAAAPFAESGRVPVRNAPTGVASVPVTRTKRGETPYLVEFVRVGTTLATPRNVSGRAPPLTDGSPEHRWPTAGPSGN